MRTICLVVLMSGCSTQPVSYSLACKPGPYAMNATVMRMGDPISDEELAKLDLPKDRLACH